MQALTLPFMYLSHNLSQTVFNMETLTIAIYVAFSQSLTNSCFTWKHEPLPFMYLSREL